MQDSVEDFIVNQKNRAIRAILEYKDRSVDRHLPADVSNELRRLVHREVNDFADAVFSVVESLSDSGVQLNALYLAKLDELHQRLVGSPDVEAAAQPEQLERQAV